MKVGFQSIPFFCLCSIVVSYTQLINFSAAQETMHHPIVPAFERFIEVEEVTDVERGTLLINELNCASCHTGAIVSWNAAPKQAPVLSDIGNRVRPEYFEKFLLDPHGTKPGTSMPDVLNGKSASEKKRIAESIGHFLATTGKTVDTPPFAGPVGNGEKLFHSIGCVACHNPQNEKTKIGTSIPLGKLSDKYTIPGLAQFLNDPLKVRPSGRMPHLSLNGSEAQDIASYLLRDVKAKSNINVAYYEGSWKKLPDFDSLKPTSTGSAPSLNPVVGPRRNDFAVVFTGFWEVAKKGDYKFRLGSDDGSRLVIDGKQVILNDGIHPTTFKNGSIKLDAGIHDVRIEYFEGGGEEQLKLEVSGPGLANQPMDGLLRATKKPPMNDDGFVWNAEKAKLGQQYFVSVGCANCHEMKVSGDRLEGILAAKKFNDLTTGGCLDGNGSVPQFGFNDAQIKSITAAMKQIQSGAEVSESAETQIHQKLATLNCYACHERNFVGGVVDRRGESFEIYGREKWFKSDQPEMGDEGRLPPAITGVGGKLNPEWMAAVLENGAKERPYMLTRMPRFGKNNIADLDKKFADADKLTDIVKVEFSEPIRKVKSIGKAFAGTSEKENGLSCVKCHTFGKYRATGIQAISLTSMSKRLNKDWFQKYMLKPSRYRPGTRMPESWPSGKTFFPEVLDGDTQKQIAAIWEYLSDGEDAPKPKGLIQAKLQLVAIDAPKMYRNFIEGAGSRAIGVGYPEEVNLAFDANNVRLAMIWQGAFIDASRHWTGRGQGYQPPLGDNVLRFDNAVSFALPDVAEKAWPKLTAKELGLRFKGYRFNKEREPTFLYQLNDVKITDQPTPTTRQDSTTFVRKFSIESKSTKSVWYRATVADKIEELSEGSFEIDGDYQLKLSDGQKSLIREANGKRELLIPIDLSDGSAQFSVEYIW